MKKPLLIALLMVTASCTSSNAVRHDERDDEIALLRQQLAQRERQIGSLEVELQKLSDVHAVGSVEDLLITSAWLANGLPGTPELTGQVTEVSGQKCTIVIDANPDNVDIKRAIDDRKVRVVTYSDDGRTDDIVGYLKFAIYDEDGHKAEVRAIGFDAATSSVTCEFVNADDRAKILIGDKAGTKR